MLKCVQQVASWFARKHHVCLKFVASRAVNGVHQGFSLVATVCFESPLPARRCVLKACWFAVHDAELLSNVASVAWDVNGSARHHWQLPICMGCVW
jgi:hypothetical protein